MTDESASFADKLPPAASAPRLAAMIYDAVLVVGVAFVASYALLALLQWSYPLPPARRTVLQGGLFVVIGAYFVVCWTHSGQTLALKAWRLKIIDSAGRPPRGARAIARYILAWHLWLPGLAIAASFELSAVWTLGAVAISFALLWIPALVDHRRRLLHDLLTGTRVVRVPG